MICNICGNEIGGASRCPYCGNTTITSASGRFRVSNDKAPTVPVNWQGNGYEMEQIEHFRNMDRWGLINIVLLSAIFIIELLRLLLVLL